MNDQQTTYRICRIVIFACSFLLISNVVADRPRELNDFDLSHCTIDAGQIQSGGPPRNGIPALTNPPTIPADEASYLNKDDLVIGVIIGDESRAYPLRILNWHENVNDVVGDRPIAISYCPLCNSATVFDRKVNGKIREFGISGLLWNSNVLLYDRNEDGKSSLWSQVGMRAVCGPAAEKNLQLQILPSEFTTWKRWTENNPDTTVLSTETGYNRAYDRNPYERYFSHQNLLFPVTASSKELEGYPRKENMLVVIVNDKVKGYPMSEIEDATQSHNSLTDTVDGTEIRIVYDSKNKLAQAHPVGSMPQGTQFGTAHMFWFAWKSIHPEAPVYRAP